MDELAQRHGVARRTLERRFRDETGMSFGMWQQKARLLYSVRALAESRPVTEAALDAGYSASRALRAGLLRAAVRTQADAALGGLDLVPTVLSDLAGLADRAVAMDAGVALIPDPPHHDDFWRADG